MHPAARIALVALATILMSPAAYAQIGSAAAVRNDVSGTMAGKLRSGSPVFQNETISAAPDSSAQLLFRDKTSLTVGPNSNVVIDQFVYNPQSGTGNAAITVTKGALRFVTGTQASSNYAVRTPTASVGVRGSVVEMFVSDLGFEVFILVEGGFEVCARDVCRLLTIPGQFVILTPTGGLSQPAAWRGPMLNLRASVDYLQSYFASAMEQGNDLLPRYRDLNDAVRADSFSAPKAPKPKCRYTHKSKHKCGGGYGYGSGM